MDAILFLGGFSFVCYLCYMLGRCAAVRDICEGKACEDLDYWFSRHSHDKE